MTLLSGDYTQINIGKRIKSSKVRNSWELFINNQSYVISLFHSKFSKKIKIFSNNEIKTQFKIPKNNQFEFNFKIGNYTIYINKQGKKLELKVDYSLFDDIQKAKTDEKTAMNSNKLSQIEEVKDSSTEANGVFLESENRVKSSNRENISGSKRVLAIPEDLFNEPVNNPFYEHQTKLQISQSVKHIRPMPMNYPIQPTNYYYRGIQFPYRNN